LHMAYQIICGNSLGVPSVDVSQNSEKVKEL
jgi:hypothetical protein